MEPAAKRRRLSSEGYTHTDEDADSTDLKLAILASLHSDRSQDVLMDYLLAYDGSVEDVTRALSGEERGAVPAKGELPRKKSRVNGYQSSLASFAGMQQIRDGSAGRLLTKKGRTLHLYVGRAGGCLTLSAADEAAVTRRYREPHSLFYCSQFLIERRLRRLHRSTHGRDVHIPTWTFHDVRARSRVAAYLQVLCR